MSNARPYYVFGRLLSLKNLICSKDETSIASTNPQLEIVLYIDKYFRVAGHALDGSMKSISADDRFVGRRVNTFVCDPLKFIQDDQYSETSVREVLSCSPDANVLNAKFVSKLLSFVKENVSSGENSLPSTKLKVEGTIKHLTKYVYNESLAITLAVRSSEEEDRRRRLQIAIETTLIGEKEWGSSGNEGTCGVCLEGFEFGERVDQMPCSHCFHKDCIRKWLIEGSNSSCPLCRFAIDY